MLLIWILLMCYHINAIKNITFDISPVELPIPLFNHISAVHGNKLHIIGGYTIDNHSNAIPSNLTFTVSLDQSINDTNHTNITFETHNNYPYFYPHPITCHYQCYFTINQSLYILLSEKPNNSLIVYDMNEYSFKLVSEYKTFSAYRSQYTTESCVVSDGQWIWVLPHNLDIEKYSVVYSMAHGNWSYIYWETLSVVRIGVGCVHYQQYLYLFGGQVRLHNNQAKYIEKCKVKSIINGVEYLDDHAECAILSGSMTHDRAFFQIATPVTSFGSHVIIYGGTTLEAKQSLEIFDLHNEQILAIDGIMNWLDVDDYSSVVLNDNILFIGGTNSKEIKYINIAQIYQNDRTPFQYDCITTINQYMFVEEYLFNNDDHELILEVYSMEEDPSEHRFYIKVEFFGTEHQTWMKKDFESNVWTFNFGDTDTFADGIADVNTISELTNIDMRGNRTALWLKWSALYDETGKAISPPIFRIGFGDVADRYPLSEFMYNPMESMTVTDVQEIFVMSFEVGEWRFYHDHCSATLSPNTDTNYTFSIDNELEIKWDLTKASLLNVPIYIKSNDIIGIDYALYILDDDKCVLCKDDSCISCVNPLYIALTDLYSYDISDNYYSVYISSQLPTLEIIDGNPIKLTRNVMDVQIVIEIASEDGLYPQSELLITSLYEYNETSQPNASITLLFDDALSFDGDGFIFIDFYGEECLIAYNNISISCSDTIIIPSSMQFKSVESNNYEISVESNDVNLIGKTLFVFPRRVQSVSISFNDTLSLGDVFSFNINVLDSKIYQEMSSIIISNHLYDIASIINVQYDSDECLIVTPITGSTQLCDKGLEIKISNNSVIGGYIYLKIESDDTFVDESIIPVFIDDCAIGQGLIGTSSSSYSCRDCVMDQINVLRNSLCVSCYHEDLSGIECLGKADLILNYNYWIAVNSMNNYSLPIFFNYPLSIISNFCPSSMCCQDVKNGCNYLYSDSNLCAPNRDSATPLCGSCIDGYSEVFGSTSCRKCDTNNYSYLLIVFGIAFVLVLVLLILDSPPKPNQQNVINYVKLIAKDDLKSIKTCYLGPMLYFFQGISYISMQTGFWFYLTPLMNILSLDLFSMQTKNEESGICFLVGLHSINKELWFLYLPFTMFISIGLLSLINFITKATMFRVTMQSVWKIFIIFIGNIIKTLLKLLACTQIGTLYVHFYAGYKPCFDFVWFFALIAFIAVIVCWLCVWFKLYRMDPQNRDSRTSSLRTITTHYKPKYWYWEIVLISRRMILSFMVTIEYISYDITQYILLAILIVYLCLHYRYYPFVYNRVNNMESICMFMLIFCLTTIIFDFNTKYPQMVSIIMSFVVASPILLFLWHLMLIIRHCFKIGRTRNNSTWIENKIINIQNRITKSQHFKLTKYVEEQDINEDEKKLNTDENANETQLEMITLKDDEYKKICDGCSALNESDGRKDENDGISLRNNDIN